MSTDLGFPSADFPGPPSFRFEIPEGWRAVPSSRADAVVVGPDALDGVHPNVVLANHKVRATDDPSTLLRAMVDQQVRRKDVSIGSELELAEDNRACKVRFTRLAAPGDSDATGEGDTIGDSGQTSEGGGTGDTVDIEAVRIEQSLNLCYIAGDPESHVAHVLAATGTYAPSSDESRQVVGDVIRSVQF